MEWAVSGSRTHYMSRLGADLPLWAQNGACKKICWNPLSGRGGEYVIVYTATNTAKRKI